MKLCMVGCSHRQTPVQLRERLAFSPQQIVDALSKLRRDFPRVEAVLLSTCNRVEIYAAGEVAAEVPDANYLRQFIADFHGLSRDEIAAHLNACTDREALTHLFTVAASLDSVVVGETQILSQVKEAYELAQESNLAGPVVHGAFQHASYVAKRVANETEIHHRRVSIPSVAVSEIAADFFERFDDKQVLVIGSGEMGQEAVRYLIAAGAVKITNVNRSRERAEELTRELGGNVAEWDQLDTLLEDADLVVSTTGSVEPIVTVDRFLRILDKRKKATILIIDLAVPRDFDAEIGRLSDVFLYAMDDIQQVCQRNMKWREQQWPKAQRIILEEVDRFLADEQHRTTGPTIQQLRDQTERIKQAELQRLLDRLKNPDARNDMEIEIRQAFDRLINKMLHPPLKSLREESHTEHHATLLDALRRLFQLKD